MAFTKNQYLTSIRSGTAYPVYRATIGAIALLGYLFAGLVAISGLGFGLASIFGHALGMGVFIIIGSLLLAAITFFLARLFKEASLVIVDLGDSTIETNWNAKVKSEDNE